ncbi:hypothetical protein A2964_01270 [Candidatus Daviesbacteria bacterium RIFCSPLOWO2_01_FULL_40_27]|nr:MAG: hypothetical protein A2964_01270 [Candidatus Daviesbacteria bacterium RIFCSPLOWO2_01_FULL_40_27]
MLKIIDDFLNGITMYRLVLYTLIFLLLFAATLSFLGILSFNFISLLFSAAFLVAVCWVTNTVFAKVFKSQTNLESVYISALILALIITPARNFEDALFLAGAAFLSQGSKYILTINKKHIFNPAAFAVFLTAITLNKSASWWVGNPWMMPAVLIGGLLVVRKIRKFGMVLTFFAAALVFTVGFSLLKGGTPLPFIQEVVLNTPILFFSFIMLTEPQTTPPAKKFQIIYGGLVGTLYFLPLETALLVGNIFSYIVSPKRKLLLKLKKKIQTSPDSYDFVFSLDKKIAFAPGQYLEWTLAHKDPDSRGSRRYFTIAASPTEDELRIGIKFYPNSSSFKKTLLSLRPGAEIIASSLAGEFTLPKDPNRKLCFIAGGIGITPYRSMIKYLLDRKQKRDIVLLYSNKLAQDIVYKDIFDAASKKLGIKTVYALTDTASVPAKWKGRVGYLDANAIREEVPDWKDRIFYLSGPHSMVDAFVTTIKGMGLSDSQIKVDFFPGYA